MRAQVGKHSGPFLAVRPFCVPAIQYHGTMSGIQFCRSVPPLSACAVGCAYSVSPLPSTVPKWGLGILYRRACVSRSRFGPISPCDSAVRPRHLRPFGRPKRIWAPPLPLATRGEVVLYPLQPPRCLAQISASRRRYSIRGPLGRPSPTGSARNGRLALKSA